MKFLKEKGFRKIASQIRSSNGSSNRVASKCGLQKIGSSWQLKCFDLNIFTGPPKTLICQGKAKKIGKIMSVCQSVIGKKA